MRMTREEALKANCADCTGTSAAIFARVLPRFESPLETVCQTQHDRRSVQPGVEYVGCEVPALMGDAEGKTGLQIDSCLIRACVLQR